MCIYRNANKNWDNKKLLKATAIFLLVFVILFIVFYIIKNQITKISDYKYPPRVYYLSME